MANNHALLSWRNWCGEIGTLEEVFGAWEPQAPMTNMQKPQTSIKAIRTDLDPVMQIDCPWSGGRPVGCVGLVNHNIISIPNANDITFVLRDTSMNVALIHPPTQIIPSAEFQSHLIFPVTQAMAPGVNLTSIDFCSVLLEGDIVTGIMDPYTGTVTAEPLSIGVLWAGPKWEPRNGLRFDAFGQGTIEVPRRVESIGGQVYAMPQQRRRTLAAEFTLLGEDEVYTKRALRKTTLPTLQQLSAWCVVSRPLIVLPIAADDELAYAQGIYGYLDQPMSWALVTRSNTGADVGPERQYRAQLQMTEAL